MQLKTILTALFYWRAVVSAQKLSYPLKECDAYFENPFKWVAFTACSQKPDQTIYYCAASNYDVPAEQQPDPDYYNVTLADRAFEAAMNSVYSNATSACSPNGEPTGQAMLRFQTHFNCANNRLFSAALSGTLVSNGSIFTQADQEALMNDLAKAEAVFVEQMNLLALCMNGTIVNRHDTNRDADYSDVNGMNFIIPGMFAIAMIVACGTVYKVKRQENTTPASDYPEYSGYRRLGNGGSAV